MNKLFVSLSVLTLLSIGSIFAISHFTNSEQNLNARATPNTATITQWLSCTNSLPSKSCEDLGIGSKLKKDCYYYSYQTSTKVYPNGAFELDSCKSFYDYYSNTATAFDPLNYNNYYQNCFLDSNVLATAQNSEYYFNQMYIPVYVTCAGFSMKK